MRRDTRLLLLLIVTLVLGTGGALLLEAQKPDLPPLAAVSEHALWMYGQGDEPQPVTGAEDYSFFDLTWSPDGSALAYVVGGATMPRLWVVDRANTTQTRLATDLNTVGLPLNWTADGQVLYAVADPDAPPQAAEDGGLLQTVNVYRIPPELDAQPTRITSIGLGTMCGGGVLFPTEARYYEEAGFIGNRLILALTPYGLVHSTDCGGQGVALTDPATGETTVLDPTLSRAKLSPDGARLAGISEGRLVVFDLPSMTQRLIDTTSTPDQVAWGAADSNVIFYTTQEATGEQVPLTEDEMKAFMANSFFTENPPDMPLYRATIHRLSLNDASDETILTQDAFAIGRMAVSPEGALVFSVIPNLTDWARGVASGAISAEDPSLLFDAFQTELWQLDLGSGQAERLAQGLSQFALNPVPKPAD